MAPLSLLKRVVYSLSSSAVRDAEIRWLATAFCSCSTWLLSPSICDLPSKYSLLTFLYFVTSLAVSVWGWMTGGG